MKYFFKQKLVLLFLISFFTHFFLLSINIDTDWNSGLLNWHGNVAYNLVKTGNLKLNPDLLTYLNNKLRSNFPKMIELKKIDLSKFDLNKSYHSYQRNPGLAILIATTWFITNDYSYIYLRIIQIFLNTFFILIIYKLILNLTKNEKYAFLSVLAYIICLPVTFLATHPSEEIWGIWTIILFIYFITKELNFKNILISSFFLGLGSYFHELPHTLIKYFSPVLFIYALFVLKNNQSTNIIKKISYSLFYTSTFIIIPTIILSPYIIRNYSLFDLYFETRYLGKSGDLITIGKYDKKYSGSEERVYEIIKEKNLKQKTGYDLSNPRYYNSIDKYVESYYKDHPNIILIHFIKNIPYLIKSRQYYGLETLGNFNRFMYKKRFIENSKYKVIDYIKDFPTSLPSIIQIFKIFWDIIIVFLVGTFAIFIYTVKTKNKSFYLIFYIIILIYGGCLRYHVEAKYHIIPYLITHIFIIIFFYNIAKWSLYERN